ncbi:unnamed protein product [Cercospora beticola]|nr:unnamed protein product [Cercospora beticola]
MDRQGRGDVLAKAERACAKFPFAAACPIPSRVVGVPFDCTSACLYGFRMLLPTVLVRDDFATQEIARRSSKMTRDKSKRTTLPLSTSVPRANMKLKFGIPIPSFFLP